MNSVRETPDLARRSGYYASFDITTPHEPRPIRVLELIRR